MRHLLCLNILVNLNQLGIENIDLDRRRRLFQDLNELLDAIIEEVLRRFHALSILYTLLHHTIRVQLFL